MGRPHRTGIMQRFEHQNWFFDVGHVFSAIICICHVCVCVCFLYTHILRYITIVPLRGE